MLLNLQSPEVVALQYFYSMSAMNNKELEDVGLEMSVFYLQNKKFMLHFRCANRGIKILSKSDLEKGVSKPKKFSLMKNLNEYKNEDGSYAKNQNSESPGLKEWNDMVKEVKQQREKRKEMKSHYEADVEGPLDTDIKNCLNSESESDDGELSILGVKITPKMTPRMTPISRKCRRATVRN